MIVNSPDWLRQHCFEYNPTQPDHALVAQLKKDLEKFQSKDPKVSIVIPAFNEEQTILNTLSSLSKMQLAVATELIVANNNSSDNTQKLLDQLGVKNVFVKSQGISHARQGGLDQARGTIVLNADADTLYPPEWVAAYLKVFEDPDVVCAYGTYHFIPGKYASRFALSLYEKMARMKFSSRSGREACKNVMGFNFGFRRNAAEKIGGFKHDLNRAETGRSEDGWMAWELYELGKLEKIEEQGNAWTGTRRLEEDGPLIMAFVKRLLPILK